MSKLIHSMIEHVFTLTIVIAMLIVLIQNIPLTFEVEYYATITAIFCVGLYSVVSMLLKISKHRRTKK